MSMDAFLDALGGEVIVARALDVNLSAISNWKARGAIPWGQYPALTKLAKRKQIEVPQRLFGISSSKVATP